MIIKPHRLNPGDGIGVVAPAGPVSPPELQTGLNLLESRGYRVVCAPHVFHKQGYLSGDDASRLQDLHAMFEDDHIKAVLCARGGYGSLRLLDRVDYALIRLNPKIFVGFSDITALLWTIYRNSGLITFHGPMLKGLERGNMTSLLDLVASAGPGGLDLSHGTVIREGRGEGTLLGGNLSLISHLIGTPFMPSMKGAVLFIEDRGEPLYRIDRMLTHLRLSGHLDRLAGCVMGDFQDCGDQSSLQQLILDALRDLDMPIMSGLPAGHGRENTALPIGLHAVLDTEAKSLSFAEPCVAS